MCNLYAPVLWATQGQHAHSNPTSRASKKRAAAPTPLTTLVVWSSGVVLFVLESSAASWQLWVACRQKRHQLLCIDKEGSTLNCKRANMHREAGRMSP